MAIQIKKDTRPNKKDTESRKRDSTNIQNDNMLLQCINDEYIVEGICYAVNCISVLVLPFTVHATAKWG